MITSPIPALVAALAALAGVSCASLRVETVAGAEPLRFDANGRFALLHITDIQVHNTNYQASLDILDGIVKACPVKPSLVVLTGDQVDGTHGVDAFTNNIAPLINFFVTNDLRFAVAFGNHDSEHGDKNRGLDPAQMREAEWAFYKSHGGACFVDFDVRELTGTGSGVVPVMDAKTGRRAAFNIFLMDSGSYGKKADGGRGGYDGCYADQIQWYADVSGDTPCLWFQHIIVPEGAKAVFFSGDRAVGGKYENPCPTQYALYVDAAHTLPPRSPDGKRRTLYDVWVEKGNLKGAYFGHDHRNTYDGTDENGIRLGYTKSITVQSYGDGDPGARYFLLNEKDGSYQTEIYTSKHSEGLGFWGPTNTIQ